MTDVVTLADVRAHLRYPAANTSDDTTLQGFISAANDVIRAECGDITQTSYDETYDGGSASIWLRHGPILEVQSVEEGWGFLNYELDYLPPNTVPTTSMYAYSIDSRSGGQITRRSAGNVVIPFIPGSNNIRVVYVAGMKAVPGAVRLAALELIAHWWTNSQFRASAQSSGFNAYDAVNEDFTRTTGVTPINAGVPYRVIELLKPFRRTPIIG